MKVRTKVGVAAGITLVALTLDPAVAHADISDALVAEYGQDSWQTTCEMLDDNLTGELANDQQVTVRVQQNIAEQYGINAITEAALVMNYQAYYFCPRHWANLVAVGEHARAQLEFVPEDVRLQYPYPDWPVYA